MLPRAARAVKGLVGKVEEAGESCTDLLKWHTSTNRQMSIQSNFTFHDKTIMAITHHHLHAQPFTQVATCPHSTYLSTTSPHSTCLSTTANHSRSPPAPAVETVLLRDVHACLSGVSSLDAWEAPHEGGAAAAGSLSVYPQGWATGVGEHMMALPQMIEAAGCADIMAAWLERLAARAGKEVAEACGGIRRMSAAGARQMAADVEYVESVVSGFVGRRGTQCCTACSASGSRVLCVASDSRFAGHVPFIVGRSMRTYHAGQHSTRPD